MRSVPVRFDISTLHTVVISPCICHYFVTFTISEEYADYEAVYTVNISSAYGRLECSAVLSGGGCQTHGPSVHFDSSLIDSFSVPLYGSNHLGRFKFKMIFTNCPKAAKDFYVPWS
jgi:hypothetical protein